MEKKISKKQLRDFGLLIGFGFPILLGWLVPSLFGHGFRGWTLLIGIPGFIIGLCAPRLLHYPYKLWIALGHILGRVNSYIVLGLIFIFILQPISYIMRIFGYDPLRKRRKGRETYRDTRKDLHIDITRIF
tara:strand:- start:255 stop:647 length:393 start_codon:yes stop_codon:yes gene_type:complete